MGRPAKPIALHLLDGKRHFTKQEIQERRDAEVKLGNQALKLPDTVAGNREAAKKWRWLVKLYKDAGFTLVTTGDKAILERYCLTWSDYRRLRHLIAELEGQYSSDPTGFMFYRAYDALDIDAKLHKLNAELLRLENHLYLNPVAKARTVSPAEKKKEKTPLEKQGFGNV